jgi:hypothetical protein
VHQPPSPELPILSPRKIFTCLGTRQSASALLRERKQASHTIALDTNRHTAVDEHQQRAPELSTYSRANPTCHYTERVHFTVSTRSVLIPNLPSTRIDTPPLTSINTTARIVKPFSRATITCHYRARTPHHANANGFRPKPHHRH